MDIDVRIGMQLVMLLVGVIVLIIGFLVVDNRLKKAVNESYERLNIESNEHLKDLDNAYKKNLAELEATYESTIEDLQEQLDSERKQNESLKVETLVQKAEIERLEAIVYPPESK